MPNRKGLERALACGYKRVAVFTAASEAFSQKNTNRTIAASLQEFAPLVEQARQAGPVCGDASTAWVAHAGAIQAPAVYEVTRAMLTGHRRGVAGRYRGSGRAQSGTYLQHLLDKGLTRPQLAQHFHDTSGTALANVLISLQLGFTTFDCSAGGLGGCPYAPGASGNLASEDLVYMLEQMGHPTGVDWKGWREPQNWPPTWDALCPVELSAQTPSGLANRREDLSFFVKGRNWACPTWANPPCLMPSHHPIKPRAPTTPSAQSSPIAASSRCRTNDCWSCKSWSRPR